MGSNVYLESVGSYGYKTESAATVIYHGIQPKAGKRIAIRAFGMTAGTSATNGHFLQVLGTTTVGTAITSGATVGLVLAAEPGGANTLASNDYIAIQVDDGTTHFSKVATGTYANFSLSTAIDDTAAAGNSVWFFGAYGDSDHLKVVITASTKKTGDVDGGMFYGAAKGYPMIAFHVNDVSGSAGSIDYVTVDYINK